MKNTSNFPPGWNEERVQRILQHYALSEDDSVAEDEAAFEGAMQMKRQALDDSRLGGDERNMRDEE